MNDQPKTFAMNLTNVDGGPCPSCGHRGELHSDRGVYGGQRTLTHIGPGGEVQACTIPMDWGKVETSADGVWSFLPHDSIPLSDQAVYHLSPGCRCSWASVGGTVGITEQHPECKVHPTPKGRS